MLGGGDAAGMGGRPQAGRTRCAGATGCGRANELDPEGPVELKAVEAVFVMVGPIWHVHLPGQVLRTTQGHPFYVVGQGWTPACALRADDLLTTPDGLTVPVQEACDAGVVETVYNWRIADHHTYFVSADEWAVSVWRTTCRATRGKNRRPETALCRMRSTRLTTLAP